MTVRNSTNELKLTRAYDAPLSAVWDAWTDPAQLAQWWGPRGFATTTHSRDLHAGGTWRYTMQGPDGTAYPNFVRYLKVVPGQRLVYDHGSTDDTPPRFRVTVLFSESPVGTQMSMVMTLPTPEALEEARQVIKHAGGNTTWDRLGEFVAQRLSGKERFIINRTFSVSRETMFRAWTDPEQLSRWLPPTGSEMSILRANIRPGGGVFFVMTAADGSKLYGRTQYRELREPERVVYTQQFCTSDEAPARHPMAPTWPETMLTVVTFVEEEPGHTRVTVQWEPDGAATTEEVDTFVNARAGMTQGWTGSFDKLEAILNAAS